MSEKDNTNMPPLPTPLWARNSRERVYDDAYSKCQMIEYAVKAVALETERCASIAQKAVCDTHTPTGINIYGTVAARLIRGVKP